MDRQSAIERLPQTYATALVLRDRGFDDAAIAAALSLELEAIPVLLGVAEEKLAALTDENERGRRRVKPVDRSEVDDEASTDDPRDARRGVDRDPGSAGKQQGDLLPLARHLVRPGLPADRRALEPEAPPGYNQGYADQLFKLARDRYPQLREVKLGCGGETTTTFRFGGICVYEQGSQLADAAAFLEEHGEEVAFVTIDIGGNDVIGGGRRPRDRGEPPGDPGHASRRGRARRPDRRDELLPPVPPADLVRDA